jgi:hypothetical protein
MKRRTFLKGISISSLSARIRDSIAAGNKAEVASASTAVERGQYHPGRIPNEYSLFLPGERKILKNSPRVSQILPGSVRASLRGEEKTVTIGDSIGGWQLLAIVPWLNGEATAVFETHVTHRGAISYVTEKGELASIPKHIGQLSKIRPRPINTPDGIRFERPVPYVPGPDVAGDYILNSADDPCFENVAALGPEMIGWTLVASEDGGAEKSLWLEADGRSRQFAPGAHVPWAPDLTGKLFDPSHFLPSEYRSYMRFPDKYAYLPGYSKRTLLGGYLPSADIGVWNPKLKTGYEVMVILPRSAEACPLGRIRAMLPPNHPATLTPPGRDVATSPSATFVDQYWNGTAEAFFAALAGIWERWFHFFDDRMKVEIPDEWLLDAARAGIVLSRTSYRGLEPTYQIGEGAYTKIPERSHALFPVAHYEFVWGHQLWNLSEEVEPYFEHYLEHFILPDGNFVYNTQDQVEATLDTGVFLENSARGYDYTHDFEALQRRLPVLRRMIGFVLDRYRYSKQHFPPSDSRHGLIWGSPEADNGDPHDDFPDSHDYYFQNAAWTWRGLKEHARCLERAGSEHQEADLLREAKEMGHLAEEMRADIERSLSKTLADRNPDMKREGITPFHAFDTEGKPTELGSYENHRYMMDWWTSDWGDPELDAGHFRHRALAGLQMLGMNTNRDYPLTSNFMEHGTLAGRIRQDDYRPFLLTLYGNLCYAMDWGSRYAPEDALIPGSYPGEGSPYGWSAVVNSQLLPTLGLRWLLCYEEHDSDVVHLQKAAPKYWFGPGETIRVEGCPTRFGPLTWKTESLATGAFRWRVEIQMAKFSSADLVVHIHPPDGSPLKSSSLGEVQSDRVVLRAAVLTGRPQVVLEIA